MLNQDLGRGRGVYISTYGCQMNSNDTERMMALLEMVNFIPVESPEKASLIIINSCSVREKPVHKVHSEVGIYRELKAKNPDLRIGVGGCVAQQEKQKLLKDIPLLDFVFGTDAIDQLPELVAKCYDTGERQVAARFENEKPYSIETMVRNPGVTAFVNIMKGCDNFCTFCVVPFTRGRERSRNLKELLTDIKSLVARGVKEVTLLGQNVNSYESECGADFGQLLKALAEDTDIARIRYTTSHPKDFNQELVDISQKYRSKICDYIHLPAQSGNTEVLKRMNRGYSREEYLDKVKMIRDGIPGVVLSTDLIVGFPGETEAQFEDTYSLIEQVRYDNIYAFKYSPRPFTKAARFDDQIPEDEKSRRLDLLLKTQREISFELAKPYDGQVYDTLFEAKSDVEGQIQGRTTHNKLVYCYAPESLIGQTVPVKVLKAFPSVLRCELVTGSAASTVHNGTLNL
ncbi:MAG: tRNA (N6-isopentenyl adenosine(37)-C2)-methylthiotransferase MiaB [Bdellovibrionaceae bacterium]|nr:tRNA (N6-isopentenyl adenosine(37)-C2)-methylthiotransferase MiaB [Pseudobdellovibrionaceae bacterium]